ncbi:GNAT family N-acetyltransferase [Pseudomonas capeferrum]|uniref:GNAT family N-acetyltransferase n=1 Tax=Pseudomonas capeferrum TaxID=1495066 RepID=UPI0015E280EE|nr:GNAT family N-acetyltransferase [Pseudomonas capeferrum]MBA1201375.1 GNAT family N-acetyltransferase [Pseudomonas capeferrum]
MSLTLQVPQRADYPRLLQIWEQSVRATHDFLPETYLVILRDHVLGKYLDAVELICCKDSAQRILGFAGASNGQVDMLFVAPECHGQGVGKRLLRHAIDELGAWQLDVNEQNPKALGFYLHQGFKVIGRSEKDGLGQPYPLLHMALADPATMAEN